MTDTLQPRTDLIRQILGCSPEEAEQFYAATLPDVPTWFRSAAAIETLLAGANRHRGFLALAEGHRTAHRAQHAGFASTDCEECGFWDAAVYDAQTGGKQLSEFFHIGAPRG